MNKQLFIFAIIILVIALVAWQFFWPAFQAVLQSRDDLNSVQAKLDEARSLNQKLADLKKKYQNLDQEIQRVSDALPQGQDISALLVQLEAVTSQNGLILNSVDFSLPALSSSAPSATPAGQVKTINIGLSLSGNYDSLKNFLKATEKSLRIMDISAINFGAASSEAAGLATFTVSLTTYYR